LLENKLFMAESSDNLLQLDPVSPLENARKYECVL
jgi:hypothetical protein